MKTYLYLAGSIIGVLATIMALGFTLEWLEETFGLWAAVLGLFAFVLLALIPISALFHRAGVEWR